MRAEEFPLGRTRQAELTVERLHEVLAYDPETGVFTWNARPGGDRYVRAWNARYAGTVAGCVKPAGYRHISLYGGDYKAARLAFLYMKGEWPEAEVDHRNLDRSDDRWPNLHPATPGQNQRNKSVYINNKLGVKGISWYKGKYVARISDGGKYRHLGRFSKLSDAVSAHNKAAAELGGEFARPSIDPDNPPLQVKIVRYGQAPLPEPRSTIAADGTVVDLEFVRYGEAVT
jgi:hypothetical protein